MDPVSNLELSNFAIMPSNCFFYNVAILRQRACLRQRLSLAVVSHAGNSFETASTSVDCIGGIGSYDTVTEIAGYVHARVLMIQ